MRRISVSFILHCLVFLIPVNICAIGIPKGAPEGIGAWAGACIQWPLVQYLETFMGTSLISVSSYIRYLADGDITGMSALSLLVWIVAAGLLIGSFIAGCASLVRNGHEFIRVSSLMILSCGILFAISDLIQYGLFFHGPAGFCIPVGIPVILYIGWMTYRLAPSREDLPLTQPATLRERCIRELPLLVLILVVIKVIVLSVTLYHVMVQNNVDLSLYHSYITQAFAGKIPYVDYNIEYPQFFLIPVFLAAVPTLLVPDHSVFVIAHIVLMCLFDIGVLAGVYLIAARLFGNDRAFACGLLYATAFFSSFAGAFSFDIVPTFFLVSAVALFLYRNEIPACLMAACGFLTKWFPAACLPFFYLFSIKNGQDTSPVKKGIVLSCILVLLCVLPFMLLNREGFLFAYVAQMGRSSEVHSLVYYLDVVTKTVTGLQLFGALSLVLLAIIEGALLYWYYRYASKKPLVLCYSIFFSVFAFILLNRALTPFFIIWIVPFLALFLATAYRQVILFYAIQLIMFLECPVLQSIVYAGGTPYGIPDVQFLFYSVKFLLFFVLLGVLVTGMNRPAALPKKKRKSRSSRGS